MDSRAILVAALMMTVAMAGCTGAGDAEGISIVSTPDDPKTQPYTFAAGMSADEYRWDFGDGREKGTGKTVDHVFGVTDGKFKVKLTTVKGGEQVTHPPLEVIIGSGQNAKAQFFFDLEWTWVEVGEEVTFSGAASTDPNNDTLLFSWFCNRVSDIAFAGAGHAHGPGGVQFATGSTSTIPSRVLNGTGMPDADKLIEGDMCAGMSSGGAFSEVATIRGAFEQPGIYEVSMLAKDPANPSEPSIRYFYVTDFPRQTEWANESFSDTIELGAPREMDGILEQADNRDHWRVHDLKIRYPMTAIEAKLTHDGGTGDLAAMEYVIRKGSTDKYGPTADDLSRDGAFLTQGDYRLIVWLRQGQETTYDLQVSVRYDTNPDNIFDAPH